MDYVDLEVKITLCRYFVIWLNALNQLPAALLDSFFESSSLILLHFVENILGPIMAFSNIAILPVEPSDYLALARIEAEAFEEDMIGAQLFGPRNEATINYRASTFGKSGRPGEVLRYAKAVTADAGGKEEIVAFAAWCKYTPRGLALAVEHMDLEVPPVPCPELFRDVIIKGDELMRESSGGEGYLSESLA